MCLVIGSSLSSSLLRAYLNPPMQAYTHAWYASRVPAKGGRGEEKEGGAGQKDRKDQAEDSAQLLSQGALVQSGKT